MLLPYFPTAEMAARGEAPSPKPKTVFVSYPNQISAQCKTGGDATWLQVAPTKPNALPRLKGSEGAGWGLHDLDVSLTIGNLVQLVASESAAYSAR